MPHTEFEQAYQELNLAQRQAVDQIDGPLLVIAGPGTGKTQLLSARVANIMLKTDTPAQNILCLTFTESGAANMRERLTRFIGQAAYEVQVSTYHAFGGDIIRRFPEYFTETRLQNPIDEIGKYQIIAAIVGVLSYKSPLKQTRHHLHDLIGTISEVKRALLNPDDLRAIAAESLVFIDQVNQELAGIFADFSSMPRKLDKAAGYYEKTLRVLKSHTPGNPVHAHLGSLGAIAAAELQKALDEAANSGKTTPLTVWKNRWLAKSADNTFVLHGNLESRRVEALAYVLERYQAALAANGLYDFDDMIIRTIDVLAKNEDLKFSLQERYLYVLLDEFQDTNAAQLRLVQLLTDNPVHEGRPNVMAVGDDDQAVYAFQGAQYSNMLDFTALYRDVAIVNLTDNYRSHTDILTAASRIAEQIDARLLGHFEGMSKQLTAKNRSLPPAVVGRYEFQSDIAQQGWMAGKIKELIDSGTEPREIAVLAPRHKHLEPLVAYLAQRGVPMRYEKRENILESPVIVEILTMARLVLALSEGNTLLANMLWPQVLSFEFWRIPISKIWSLSWQVADSRKNGPANWTSSMLADDATFRIPALLFMSLAYKLQTETCDSMLDYLVGNAVIDTFEEDLPTVSSPLRDYYLSKTVRSKNPTAFYETISHLTVLRTRLREHQAAQDKTLMLADLLAFVALYQSAGERMINTSPYNQASNAVQLMTVFKAKGQEFEHVFLPCCSDDVWGGSGGSGGNKLTLPANLAPIRHSGATDDERLRILFVAVTRAKCGLYLTSYDRNYAGKATKRLKYFNEQEQIDGSTVAQVLPEHVQSVIKSDHTAPELQTLELDWGIRHALSSGDSSLFSLLQNRLQSYRLSPTHLNTFTDLIYGGPNKFFFSTLLRFPVAPTADGQFGNAIHETLEWLQYRVSEQGGLPPAQAVIDQFMQFMERKRLQPDQLKLEKERGEAALSLFIKQRGYMYQSSDKAEVSFRDEGVIIGKAHMAGKIDRMEINKEAKTITVVDYKTGKSYGRWASDAKLHKYKQQLYCYKLLIENSHTYKGYEVQKGRIEFVEPDQQGTVQTLVLRFDDDEMERIKHLIDAMWEHVQALNLPDTSTYPATLAGIKAFEQDLLDGGI